jgi:hypothetical protein
MRASLRPRRAEPAHLRVGLVWAAGDWRRERSVPPGLLLPLTRLPLDFVGLQLGPARRDDAGRALVGSFVAALPEDVTITETAALICGLDLVVSVDTMVAHLAGALGRPVWTVLDADADWRWMRRRDDSPWHPTPWHPTPWYPTMRLFRQQQPGRWQPLVEALAAALTVAARRHARNASRRRPVEVVTAANDGEGNGHAQHGRGASYE